MEEVEKKKIQQKNYMKEKDSRRTRGKTTTKTGDE